MALNTNNWQCTKLITLVNVLLESILDGKKIETDTTF